MDRGAHKTCKDFIKRKKNNNNETNKEKNIVFL